MIRKLAKSVREYKAPTVLTLIFIVGEVIIECFIPFITAQLVNNIKGGVAIGELLKTGLTLFVLAMLSLACGGIAGYTCSKASAGFAKNLRHDVFSRVQTFTFSNIDNTSSGFLLPSPISINNPTIFLTIYRKKPVPINEIVRISLSTFISADIISLS